MNIMLESVKKIYGERTVLDIDNLQVEPGSLIFVIGQNGAGKSTMLNIIAGIETCSSGRVCYGPEKSTAPDIKKITLVTQHPYLIRTTVEKNIAYPLKIRGWSEDRIKKRVETLIEEFGLTRIKKQKAWRLSAGEGQKVALARALSFNPEILLLDEPTANIDPGATSDIEAILKRNNKENKITTVIITHNLAQARRLCGEALFLHEGRLLERGDCQKIFSAPQNPLTAKFIAGELI